MNPAAHLELIWAPLIMCFILIGIHCYLGLHVLARGVIFVDLALAQVAALGSAFALTQGLEHEELKTYFVSLGFTLGGAAFLALANRLKRYVSQEAVIGITYAFCSALLMLILDRSSHGAEHLKQALVGQLLWVTWGDVGRIALIYSAVSILHFIFRKNLIQASFDENPTPWIWDFLFYALFAVIITSSVHTAGVLLVFSFLIVPSFLSSLFFSSLLARLIFGWSLGLILCSAGMWASFAADVPSGALIVAVFAGTPLLTVLALQIPKLRAKLKMI